MNPADDGETLKRRDRAFTIAIPALAFGGILVAALLQQSGMIADAGTFAWGCVAASFLLGYFALIKPKRDIVAICTPIYGIIIFLVPGEIPQSLPLQFLFAVSITILLVRLNKKFGSLADPKGDGPMEKFLRQYIDRIRPDLPAIPKKTAHEIASAFLAFKFGLYGNAVEECQLAMTGVPEGKSAAAVKKALQIVSANAESLENSQVTLDESITFTTDEKAFVAVSLPEELVEDTATLDLDNALTMIYAVAAIMSPDDEQSLEEHQNFVIKLLSSYRKELGIR